jgi:hypothetical protein
MLGIYPDGQDTSSRLRSTQSVPKGRKPRATFRIGIGIAPTHHGGKQSHALALLRARRDRPSRRSRRAA